MSDGNEVDDKVANKLAPPQLIRLLDKLAGHAGMLTGLTVCEPE